MLLAMGVSLFTGSAEQRHACVSYP